ncbi:hypothetical protein F5B17DRAFT_353678 [Nemania serpens]|nr:hypothetical protein F5B17DRAFT_353678 [Nemania serpens]
MHHRRIGRLAIRLYFARIYSILIVIHCTHTHPTSYLMNTSFALGRLAFVRTRLYFPLSTISLPHPKRLGSARLGEVPVAGRGAKFLGFFVYPAARSQSMHTATPSKSRPNTVD